MIPTCNQELGILFSSEALSILGHPQPVVKWLHNGELLSDSSRATMQQLEDGLCSLVLVDLTPSDSGVYVCRAKNQLGEAMCAAKLHVGL